MSSTPGIAGARRVLLVDDEPVVLDVLVRLLRSDSMFVETAQSAEKAEAMLAESPFAVLVTDKNMPGSSGIELIVRARKRQPLLECILITGYPSAEALLWTFGAGASDFLLKPFPDLNVVRAKLNAAADRYVQRARGASESVSREAAQLLMAEGGLSDRQHSALSQALRDYEKSIAQPDAAVLMDSAAPFDELLRQDGVRVTDKPSEAMVIVGWTGAPEWRQRVEQLRAFAPGVPFVLAASPSVPMEELLDVVELGISVVPVPELAPSALLDRVRAVLRQRSVEGAQTALAAAMERVRTGAS